MATPILEKVYDPRRVEGKWYDHWIRLRLFHADPHSPKPKYTIMIPPPNVTGMLTMGHILNNTLQDLLIRYKKMEGYETLWMPGTDHAGIATQNKVEEALRKEGITRHDLGREGLISRIWAWKEEYGGIILKQLRKLGASCDWERERFTMDEGLSRAVREVFVCLYHRGLIYRGRRLINWCPRCQTALADEEAPSQEIPGKFWHIAYPIEGSPDILIVSTTRPETLLGDTAVAVHPEDDRYRSLIGRKVRLPLVGRLIPVIADTHADPIKGSGVVKITPAHDFDDFEVGLRHGLAAIQVMDASGTMNGAAGPYAGLDRFAARERILADLAAQGLLRGEEPRLTPIPHCYRCDTVVEPYLSEQWFVRMALLAGPAIEAVRQGRIRFYPSHWEETYFHWMTHIKDWCISRQIWWGHRIPVWTCPNGHLIVVTETPERCPECGASPLEQDPDVLDTWFSSWLWPFSTLGWPEETEDLKAFFPTDTLVTGPDIIFFWVARMIMASLEFMGDVPFRQVYFNGMIRDLQGRKMSKSLGNSPDPLWLIDGVEASEIQAFAEKNPSYRNGVPAYGADAVRMTMVYLTPLGGDIHFDHPLVEMGQKFANKLWNAARFVLLHVGHETLPSLAELPPSHLETTDRWILSRLSAVIREVREGFDGFRFHDSARALYSFVWNTFCDWYLELIKPRLYDETNEDRQKAARVVVLFVLEHVLRLLHPIMPFITEEIWQALPHPERGKETDSILLQPYPQGDPGWDDRASEEEIHFLQEVIGAVRNIRGEMNMPKGKKADLWIRGPEAAFQRVIRHAESIGRLAEVGNIAPLSDGERPADCATAVVGRVELFVPLVGLIDLEVERNRLRKEFERITEQIAGLEKKLSNPDFLSRAPAEVVEKEQRKYQDFLDKQKTLEAHLGRLGG